MPNVVGRPFRHLILDDVWDPALLDQAVVEFPEASDRRWHWFHNEHEFKAQSTGPHMYGQAQAEILRRMASDVVGEIEAAFGIDDMEMGTEGGGLHLIPPRGHLGVHYDFNRRADGWHRRINCLLFLNRDWQDEWGGHLELWDQRGPKVKIAPVFNRMVLFETSDRSWHGHPYPLATPDGVCRRSIAAYFYTQQAPPGATAPHSTVFHPKSEPVR